MSKTKEWMMELEYVRMIQWMRENYNIPDGIDIDESYPDFEGMEAMYQHELDNEEYEAQLKWFEEHPLLETYGVFTQSLTSLKDMANQSARFFSDTAIHRMAYVHAVTLFEAMVGDLVKTALFSFPHLMSRFIENLPEDKNLKFTVKEVAEWGVNGIVMNIISREVFHNHLTVKKYVYIVTGEVLPDTYMNRIKQVIDMRHDFVHRNGKTVAGESHNVDAALVVGSIEVIEGFARDVYEILSKAVAEK